MSSRLSFYCPSCGEESILPLNNKFILSPGRIELTCPKCKTHFLVKIEFIKSVPCPPERRNMEKQNLCEECQKWLTDNHGWSTTYNPPYQHCHHPDLLYCNICGTQLTEIRGRNPGDSRRMVCATCLQEGAESFEETTLPQENSLCRWCIKWKELKSFYAVYENTPLAKTINYLITKSDEQITKCPVCGAKL